jgi:hypothetical protein
MWQYNTALGQTSFCAVLKSAFFVLDDEALGPDSSQFPLAIPQKQTKDLEDWLDSMLDD